MSLRFVLPPKFSSTSCSFVDSLLAFDESDGDCDDEACYQLIDPSGWLSSTSRALFEAFASSAATFDGSTVTRLTASCLRAI